MLILTDRHQKILDFLKTQPFGVISTQSEPGQAPESAVVAFSETDELEIVIGSFSDTRKNRNIAKRAQVSFVTGWDADQKTTVQIEGRAVLLEGEERARCQERHCQKNALSLRYVDDPRQQSFKIIPEWMRYSDFSGVTKEVWEIRF